MKTYLLCALLLVLGTTSFPAELRAGTVSAERARAALSSDEDSDDDSDSDSDRKKKNKNRRNSRDRAQSRTSDICFDRNRDGICDDVERPRDRRDRRDRRLPRDRGGDTIGGILGSVIRDGLFRAQPVRMP